LAAALAATVSRAGVTRAAASASLSGGLPGGRQAVIGPAGAVGEDAGAAVGAGRGSAWAGAPATAEATTTTTTMDRRKPN